LKELEARAGIEPAHKGFAVWVAGSKLLTNMEFPPVAVPQYLKTVIFCPVFSLIGSVS
jgi:hypothetical protein